MIISLLPFIHGTVKKYLNVGTAFKSHLWCMNVIRSNRKFAEICYIIDWGFHIIAMGLIATRGCKNSSIIDS